MERSNIAVRLAILAVLALAAVPAGSMRATAQESDDETRLDGTRWGVLSTPNKRLFVLGFWTGQTSLLYLECKGVADRTQKSPPLHDSCIEKKQKALGVLLNPKTGLDQFADGMDHFYADYRNRTVNMMWIAQEVEKQLGGASDDEINRDLEELRQLTH